MSPSTRLDAGGSYTASVSIRSGYGSATHDRVFRFLPVFPSRRAAVRYAKNQGLAWIAAPASLTSVPVFQPE